MFRTSDNEHAQIHLLSFLPPDSIRDGSDDDVRFVRESFAPSGHRNMHSGSGSADGESASMYFRYRVVDPVGFDHVNTAMVHATGYRAIDFYSNADLLTLITLPEDQPTIVALLNASQPVNPTLVRWTTRHGDVIAVELRTRQITNEDGEVVALDVTAHQMTTSKDSMNGPSKVDLQLRAVLDFTDDALGILRGHLNDEDEISDFTWEYANRAASVLLNDADYDLTGTHLSDTFPGLQGRALIEFFGAVVMNADNSTRASHTLLLNGDLSISAARRGERVIVSLQPRNETEQSFLSKPLADLAEDILDQGSNLNDRLAAVADALLNVGADFAIILANRGGDHLPLSILRSADDFLDREPLCQAINHWEQSQSDSVSTLNRGPQIDGLVVLTSAPEISEHHVNVDRQTLSFIESIHPSSLHAVSLRGAHQEIGTVLFGTSKEHSPLSDETLRLTLLMIRPVTNLIEIVELRDEMKAASVMREDFMSIVAHEIKTPLTGIRGYGQLLERYMFREQPDLDHARRAVSGLRTQIERFLTLANDLLDATRIHHGRLDLRLEPCDLRAVAQDAIERISTTSLSNNRVVKLDVEGPVMGVWDAARIDQVLFILLSNALSYSQQGPVRMSLRQDKDHVLITVSDEGMGIEQSDVRNLFVPFERGAKASGMAEGSGLGLYLAREIVLHHGGQISIRSQPKIGTTVTVQLPMEAVPNTESM